MKSEEWRVKSEEWRVESGETFSKKERLCSKSQIEKLFTKGNPSASQFPIRMIYQQTEEEQPTQILISVPKRYFHHAVDRNRVKRQIREAYRKNKHLLPADRFFNIAFIWVDGKHRPTAEVENKIVRLLVKVEG